MWCACEKQTYPFFPIMLSLCCMSVSCYCREILCLLMQPRGNSTTEGKCSKTMAPVDTQP